MLECHKTNNRPVLGDAYQLRLAFGHNDRGEPYTTFDLNKLDPSVARDREAGRERLREVLSDGKARTYRELAEATDLAESTVRGLSQELARLGRVIINDARRPVLVVASARDLPPNVRPTGWVREPPTLGMVLISLGGLCLRL